jgi:hypothetical protein
MFSLFDPNQTIKHIPYKVLKAKWKRDQERTDMFFRVLMRASLAVALILSLWLFVSSM